MCGGELNRVARGHGCVRRCDFLRILDFGSFHGKVEWVATQSLGLYGAERLDTQAVDQLHGGADTTSPY
jgi:hypothetical protein